MRRRTDERNSCIQMTGVHRVQTPAARGLCAVIEQLQSARARRNTQSASNTVLCLCSRYTTFLPSVEKKKKLQYKNSNTDRKILTFYTHQYWIRSSKAKRYSIRTGKKVI